MGNTELLVPFWGKVCVCERTAVLPPVQHRGVLGVCCGHGEERQHLAGAVLVSAVCLSLCG